MDAFDERRDSGEEFSLTGKEELRALLGPMDEDEGDSSGTLSDGAEFSKRVGRVVFVAVFALCCVRRVGFSVVATLVVVAVMSWSLLLLLVVMLSMMMVIMMVAECFPAAHACTAEGADSRRREIFYRRTGKWNMENTKYLQNRPPGTIWADRLPKDPSSSNAPAHFTFVIRVCNVAQYAVSAVLVYGLAAAAAATAAAAARRLCMSVLDAARPHADRC